MAVPEEIVPGVYAIRLGYVNAFIIVGDGEAAFVDSGLRGRKEKILGAAAAIGKQPGDFKHILITHHHGDHMGSLADLKEATEAIAYAHPADSPVVRGEQRDPGPNPASRLGKLVWPLLTRSGAPRPAGVEVEVTDGQELAIAGGVLAVHTPGHTPGHLAYLLRRDGGILFAGDAAGNIFRLGMAPFMFTRDVNQAKASIAKLAALEFETACFGHGRVLKGQANLKFRRLVEKLAR
ncbi:MAG TPA: MBL fold metallo-hydrolase [Dehalococcoidia bacterium]|nr:MBL fold metallo-hydrolase [Dehalococcoidia bacterium]